jgi:hypothetical protein
MLSYNAEAYAPRAVGMESIKPNGSSLFCVGNFVRQVGPRSAMLRLFKVECGIKGILPACGGPLPFIPFLA